jgi:hypothetical protein
MADTVRLPTMAVIGHPARHPAGQAMAAEVVMAVVVMAGIDPHPIQLQVGRAMAGAEVEDAPAAADPVAAARGVAAVGEAAPTGAAGAVVAAGITTKSLSHL